MCALVSPRIVLVVVLGMDKIEGGGQNKSAN